MENIQIRNHNQWFQERKLAYEKRNNPYLKTARVALLLYIIFTGAFLAQIIFTHAATEGIKAKIVVDDIRYQNIRHK